MAKKPAAATTHDADDIPPAMDYAQHQATWNAFMAMVKWGIVATAIICIALYFFIEGQQPVIGTLLLLLIPVGAVALVVMRSRTAD
jgi:hypothetical protein